MSVVFPNTFEISEEPSRTWKLDFERKCVTGYIDGLDAVAQAALMTLLTPRYKTLILSWQYGSELETLIGADADYADSEAKRMIRDALSVDSRVLGVRDFVKQGAVLHFTLDTIYGSRQIETEVTV